MNSAHDFPPPPDEAAKALRAGLVIPAHPLALNGDGALDESHQRALSRYYLDCGAGGLAVGVHTTEFAIHDPKVGLYRPVLELAMETVRTWKPPIAASDHPVMIAGIIGKTAQAVGEAQLARDLGYHVGLLGLVAGVHPLGEGEGLSPGQAEKIDAVIARYPHLIDHDFVRENLDRWLA